MRYFACGFAIAISIGVVLASCGPIRPPYPSEKPEPSPVVSQYTFPVRGYTSTVTEFRDSLGRTCVYVSYQLDNGALDCDWPINYSIEEKPE